MRIKHKPKPCRGDSRIKWKFLWFPKRIKDETRWLEVAKWQQNYIKVRGSGDVAGMEIVVWVDIEWINN